jgi:hypothetical protein
LLVLVLCFWTRFALDMWWWWRIVGWICHGWTVSWWWCWCCGCSDVVEVMRW